MTAGHHPMKRFITSSINSHIPTMFWKYICDKITGWSVEIFGCTIKGYELTLREVLNFL